MNQTKAYPSDFWGDGKPETISRAEYFSENRYDYR